MDERWLAVDDICKYLNVSNETVYKWIEQRAMPGRPSLDVQTRRSERMGPLWWCG